jgi:hypothetical protein
LRDGSDAPFSPGAAEDRFEGRDTEKEALNAKLAKVGAVR